MTPTSHRRSGSRAERNVPSVSNATRAVVEGLEGRVLFHGDGRDDFGDVSGNLVPWSTAPLAPALTVTQSESVTPPPADALTTSVTAQTLRINVGGKAYTDSLGHAWSADAYATGGTVPTNTYDVASELEKGTSVSYSYDEMGERTKTTPGGGPATTYGYDQAGNLAAVTRAHEGEVPAIEDSYAYDGDGLRASQTISGTTSYMAWDSAATLPLLLADGANSYIYGPGNVLVEQVSSGGTVLYVHHDQQNSSRLLTGSTGTVAGTMTYDAYGNTGSTRARTRDSSTYAPAPTTRPPPNL